MKAAADDDVHADAETEVQALARGLSDDTAARPLRPRVLDGAGDAARLAGLRARLTELLSEQVRHLAEAVGAWDGRRRTRNWLPVGVGLVGRAVREVDRIAPVGIHQVDLVVPGRAAVRGERDLRAVGRPGRVAVVGGVVRQVRLAAAVGVHDEDLAGAAVEADERDLHPVGRPHGRVVVVARRVRHVLRAAAVGVGDEDLRVGRLDGPRVGDLAGRRPGGLIAPRHEPRHAGPVRIGFEDLRPADVVRDLRPVRPPVRIRVVGGRLGHVPLRLAVQLMTNTSSLSALPGRVNASFVPSADQAGYRRGWGSS